MDGKRVLNTLRDQKIDKIEADMLSSFPALHLQTNDIFSEGLYAREMLGDIDYLKNALVIPLCHHENWDGTGYPGKLKKTEIPLIARLFSIVDNWDALNSDRPYRKAWKREDIINYIRENSEKKFDPRLVEVFLNII